MPKKLTFQNPFRKRSAVDHNDREIAPIAVAVDCPRNQFLASAAFSTNHHRGVRLRHRLDQFIDLLHLRRFPDDLIRLAELRNLLFEFDVFRCKRALLQRVINKVREIVRIYRFCDVVECALFQSLHCCVDCGVCSDEDDRCTLVDPLDALLQLHTVHARHLDVKEDNIPFLHLQLLEGLSSIGC